MPQNNRIDAVILDVDGTLWNSTEIVAGAWTRAVHEGGFSDLEVTPDRLKHLFGKTMKRIADELMPQAEETARYAVLEKACVYEEEALEADPCRICYPGVPETIKALSRVLSVCIVSNCQAGYIELFLRKTGLGEYVKDVECYGNNGRSKAQNIRLVAERNEFQNPVYVGDTQGDLESSREAGIPFWWASYGFGKVKDCDRHISAFGEVLDGVTESFRTGS